jgi:predicted RNA-binding protein with PUA-like domain
MKFTCLLTKPPKADLSFQTEKAEGDVELSYTTENKYKTRLIIKRAQYGDTGYYYCVSNKTAECRLQIEGVHRKYIYVKGQSMYEY